MGDGYTKSEKDLFLSDMKRLHHEMFTGVTYASYLPLFNIWAVYRSSVESGIGTHGKPKNTAYGLYRDGTELRGVYWSKPDNARQSCKATGPNACEYPTIIGNDPYYGGLGLCYVCSFFDLLGGEFTVSTSSPTSGTVVLRHEWVSNSVFFHLLFRDILL
jgi:hypothetical protein